LLLTEKALLVIAFTVFTVLDPALAGLVWFVSTIYEQSTNSCGAQLCVNRTATKATLPFAGQ